MSRKIAASAALVGIALVDAGAARAAPAYNWSGFYIGAEVGGWQQSIDYSGGLVGSSSPSGIIGGGYGGYNYQLPSNIVLGIEGRIDGTNITDTFGTLRHSTGWTASIVGRLGYAVSPTVMPYVSGGVAFADECLHFPLVSESNTRTGWTIGAGAEINFPALWANGRSATSTWPGFTTRVEWRHSDFGTVDNFGDLHTKLVSDAFLVGFSTKIGKYRA